MGVVGGLVEEQVVHDDAFHRLEAGRDVMRVGVGLQDVLALDVDALERAVDGGVEHVGDAQARLRIERDAPQALVDIAGGVVGHVAIARQFVRERAHVAGALHIVLAAQRVHADARPADIAGQHGEVGDRHHRGRALAVLGDAEAVVDRAIAALGEQPCRAADFLRRHAGKLFDFLRAVLRLGNEGRPVLELRPVAAFADEFFVEQPFGDDDMRQRRHHGDIGAGLQRQVILRLDMRRAHDVGAARIDDDQLGALASAASSAARRTPGGRRSGWRR